MPRSPEGWYDHRRPTERPSGTDPHVGTRRLAGDFGLSPSSDPGRPALHRTQEVPPGQGESLPSLKSEPGSKPRRRGDQNCPRTAVAGCGLATRCAPPEAGPGTHAPRRHLPHPDTKEQEPHWCLADPPGGALPGPTDFSPLQPLTASPFSHYLRALGAPGARTLSEVS